MSEIIFGNTHHESELIEAAIAYKEGCANHFFACEHGGLNALESAFFEAVDILQKDTIEGSPLFLQVKSLYFIS